MDDLTIAVLSHNSEETLERCLGALSPCPEDSHLILLDNASTDASVTSGRRYGAMIVHLDNRKQFITGLNAALSFCHTKWLLFISNDVFLHPGCLETMLLYAKTLPPCILQPALYNTNGTPNHLGAIYWWPGVGITRQGHSLHPIEPIDLFATSCFLIAREVIDAVGLFEEALAPAYYEDVDFSIRCAKQKIPRYLCTTARATHLSTFTFHRTHTKQQLSQICRDHRRWVVQRHFKGLNRASREWGLWALERLPSPAESSHGDTYQLAAPSSEGLALNGYYPLPLGSIPLHSFVSTHTDDASLHQDSS